MSVLYSELWSQDEEEPIYVLMWKYFLVMSFGIIFGGILLCLAIYLIFKIFKLVSFKGDPILVLSILSMTLSLSFYLSFLILDMIRLLSYGNNPIFNLRLNIRIIEQLDRGKLMFMFIS